MTGSAWDMRGTLQVIPFVMGERSENMEGVGDGKRLGHARNVAGIPFVMGERSENMEGVGSEGGGWSGLTGSAWDMRGTLR